MVLLRWQRAGGKVVEGARGIVGGVEIHPRSPSRRQGYAQKSAATIGATAVGAIREHHEQCLIVWILQHRIEPPLLSIAGEYQRAGTVHFLLQAEYVDDPD